MGGHSPISLDHWLTPGNADSAGIAPPAIFSALKRVHCIVGNAAYAGRVITKFTALASSSLTHLRISALDRRASDVPGVLERVLEVQARRTPERAVGEGNGGGEELRMLRLRRIIIHSAASPQDANIDGVWTELSARIADVLVDACDGGGEGVRGLYLERPFQRNPHWPERLRNDWIARIEGRKGCWVESEEESALEICDNDP